MKVKDLIEALKLYDEELELKVYSRSACEYFPTDEDENIIGVRKTDSDNVVITVP